MQLTRHTDLGLRVLLFVGLRSGKGVRVTMGDVASFYRVSHEQLRKAVHRLGRAGFLQTTQGRRGGLALGRAPGAITVAEVVELMERDLSIVDCDANRCLLRGGCALKQALDEAARAFMATLRHYTLADLLVDRRMQRQFRDVIQLTV